MPDPSAPLPVMPGIPDDLLIRPMVQPDASQVLAIYQAGLDTGQASFETAAPEGEVFDAARLPAHRHVAADACTGEILGWVAASSVSSRAVYAGVIEHSVYVHPGHYRRGVGAALLGALIRSSEAAAYRPRLRENPAQSLPATLLRRSIRTVFRHRPWWRPTRSRTPTTRNPAR